MEPGKLLNRPVLLLFSGRPATGKSTLANAVANELSGSMLLTAHGVRIQLGLLRWRRLLDDDARRSVLETLSSHASDALTTHSFVVVDTNCIDDFSRGIFLEIALRHQAEVFIVECCAPTEIVIDRMFARLSKMPNAAKFIQQWIEFVDVRSVKADPSQFSGCASYDSQSGALIGKYWNCSSTGSVALLNGLFRATAKLLGQGTNNENYLLLLRAMMGRQKLIVPSVRAVFLHDGQVLLVRRRDSGEWALISGTLEIGESAPQCLRREVFEETGLRICSERAVALQSSPTFCTTNVYGDEQQAFAVIFLIEEWEGTLVSVTTETQDAAFFPVGELPISVSTAHQRSIEIAVRFRGSFLVE